MNIKMKSNINPQQGEHKSVERQPISESGQSETTKVVYLFDVDDTLMVNNGDELCFNQKIIDTLHFCHPEQKPILVTLLTKMDAHSLSYTSTIRLPLLTHLEKNGIKVEKIMTPLDLLYKSTAVDPKAYQLGTAYEKLMKPVEETISIVRQKVTRKEFDFFGQALTIDLMLKDCDFLIKNKILNEKDIIGKITKKQDALMTALDKIQLEDPSLRDHAVDFSTMASVFGHMKRISRDNPNMTVQDFMNDLQKQKPDEEKMEGEKQKIVAAYFDAVTKYRNYKNYAEIKYRHDHPQHEGDLVDFTKGQVYEDFVRTHTDGSELIIFVDDSDKEHVSLKAEHTKHNFKNRLVCLKPPYDPVFSGSHKDYYISPENYLDCHVELFKHELVLNQIKGATPKEADALFQKKVVNDLRQNANNEAKSNNYLGAITLYQIAYLCADKEAKDGIVKDAISVTKGRGKSSQEGYVDNFKIESLLQDCKKENMFDTTLQLIEFRLRIHDGIYDFTNQSKAWTSFFSTINEDSLKRLQSILVDLFNLRKAFPAEAAKCDAVVNGLEQKFASSSKIKAAIKEIKDDFLKQDAHTNTPASK